MSSATERVGLVAAQPTAKILTARCDVELRAFTPVFQRWIQADTLEGLLIDVADYSHVHHGPGILLVAHEAYYGMDEGAGRLGMLYRRRRGEAVEPRTGLLDAAAAAARAATLLEEEFGERLAFDAGRLVLGFDDRLRAPSTPATRTALAPTLEALGRELLGQDCTVGDGPDARGCFRATLSAAEPLTLAELSARIARAVATPDAGGA